MRDVLSKVLDAEDDATPADRVLAAAFYRTGPRDARGPGAVVLLADRPAASAGRASMKRSAVTNFLVGGGR
jgi:hypothetical protein